MTALTDFETGQHYYPQQPIFFGRDITLTSEKVGLNGNSEMRFSGNELQLDQCSNEYILSLDMKAVKPPVWHCEDGILNSPSPRSITGTARTSRYRAITGG